MQTENPLFQFDNDFDREIIQVTRDQEKEMILVGVDPDVEKSGVCIYVSKTKFELYNMPFFKLYDKLYYFKQNHKLDIEIFVEAGWLNKSNWHKVSNGSAAINANIGLRTGAIHEVGRKIVEMCQYLGLKHHLIKPTKSKVNAETFKAITNYQGRNNSEMRDSCMLVWNR